MIAVTRAKLEPFSVRYGMQSNVFACDGSCRTNTWPSLFIRRKGREP